MRNIAFDSFGSTAYRFQARNCWRRLQAYGAGFWHLPRAYGAVLLAALVASACGPGDRGAGYGSVVVQAAWPGQPGYATASADGGFHSLAAPAGVNSVRAIVSGPGMSSMSRDFAATPGQPGSGSIDGVPAGNGRTVTLQGLVGTNILWEGTSGQFTVVANQSNSAGIVAMGPADYARDSRTASA